MHKASRKYDSVIDDRTREGLALAGEIVRHPNVLPTFASIAHLSELSKKADMSSIFGQFADVIGDDELAQSLREAPLGAARAARRLKEQTPQGWAEGMQQAFCEQKFADFIERMIRVAHKKFWTSDPHLALQFGWKPPAPADHPVALAMTRAHHKLTADPRHPGWIALALFCLGRAIAVNSEKGYHSDEWSDLTLMWFALEKSFLEGDGRETAKGFLKIAKMFSPGPLRNNRFPNDARVGRRGDQCENFETFSVKKLGYCFAVSIATQQQSPTATPGRAARRMS